MVDKMLERDKLLIMQEKITTPHNIMFQSSHSLSAAHPSSALANRASAHGMSGRLKALERLKHGNVSRNHLLVKKFTTIERIIMERKLQFATKAIIIDNTKVLCLYKDHDDGRRYWDFPGGRIEFGENPEEGLLREVQEEIGCDVEVVRLVDTWNHMPNEEWQIVGVFYYCRLLNNNIQISDEHSGYKWIPIDDLHNEFKARAFLKRIEGWNWEELMNDNSKVVYPVELIEISKLVPNNLYLNGDKVEALSAILESEFEDIVPPVLVTKIDGEYSLIDGHSRVFVALKQGKNRIKAIVQPLEVIGMERLYTRIHNEAKSLNILTVEDLENRILYGKEHEEKWVGFCKKMLAELEIN